MDHYRVYEVRTFVLIHETHPGGQDEKITKSVVGEINNLASGDLVIVTANLVVPAEEKD
jgi:hypothetical protein